MCGELHPGTTRRDRVNAGDVLDALPDHTGIDRVLHRADTDGVVAILTGTQGAADRSGHLRTRRVRPGPVNFPPSRIDRPWHSLGPGALTSSGEAFGAP